MAIRPEIKPQNLIRLIPAEESEMLTSVVMACHVARAEEPAAESDDRSPELIIVTGPNEAISGRLPVP